MKIRIITDSAADIPVEFYEQYDIGQIPHVVLFEDKLMKIGKDISLEEYYELLDKVDEIPSSSVPEPGDFDAIFKETFEDKGYDAIICINVSQELSSTSNVARLVAQEYGDRIAVFNSASASGVQGLLVLTAAKLAKQGVDMQNIIEILEKMKNNSFLDVGFYTLDNVFKSGRLKSKFVLHLTKFLRIKPIAVLEKPGLLQSKLPGFISGRAMENRLIKLALQNTDNNIEYDMIITHVNNLKGIKRIIDILTTKRKIKGCYQAVCSPIIGTNTGNKTIILSLVPTYEEINKMI